MRVGRYMITHPSKLHDPLLYIRDWVLKPTLLDRISVKKPECSQVFSPNSAGLVTDSVVFTHKFIIVLIKFCYPFLSILELENGNVSQDEAAALKSHSARPVNQLLSVSSLNPAFAPSNPGTPRVSPSGTPHHTDDELDAPVRPDVNRTRIFKRQRSRDSQTGKGQYDY